VSSMRERRRKGKVEDEEKFESEHNEAKEKNR
jgi:hypothetical protein